VRILSLVLSAIVTTMLLTVAPSAAETREKYPVPYTFLPSAVSGGAQANAPGSNIWTCKPTKRHPRPVVLVHGTSGNQSTNWQTYAPLLANKGYCVFALTYGVDQTGVPGSENFGGMTRIQDSAKELKRFIAKVLRTTGAAKVDILGHSQGTLMPNYYAKFLGGAKFIKRYVSLAPLWRGTRAAQVSAITSAAFGAGDESTPVCVACGQMARGSAFMKKMRAGGVAVDGITYTNIMTEYDQLVIPYTSGREKGMRNRVVQDFCETDYSEHFQIAADIVGSQLVLNALAPKRKKPVPCEVVLPFVGTPTTATP
jgi:triacylglycerol lipase